ncbi:hypothetical protein [Cryobacterium sp. BB736]|uniref:hypothetical protein n=1 Tax=Cryobacterium sp. BB736 TaxID=2746963 RepID=UPI0018736C9B|nr:hypothetical protein [Cryobacterium sp. BB736]
MQRVTSRCGTTIVAAFIAVGAVLTLTGATGFEVRDEERGEEAAAAQAARITSPADGAFIGTDSVTISGTKEVGAGIRFEDGPVGCAIAANAELTWSCTATGLPNGAGYVLQAVHIAADGEETALDPVTIHVLAPPSIAANGPILTTGIISGAAHPGSTIVLRVSGSDQVCPGVARGDGFWSCSIPTSGQHMVSASQSHPTIGGGQRSNQSGTVQVMVDKELPDAPIITSPRSQSRLERLPATVTGIGEAGARVDVYLDGLIVCRATVEGTRWSCQFANVPNGSHTLQALQRDMAGNFSSPSTPITVWIGPRETAPKPGDPPTVAPEPEPEEQPEATPTPAPTPGEPTLPDWPPSGAAPPTLEEALTNWGTPTGFGTRLMTPAGTLAGGNWLLALGIAGGFIALIAVPMRLFATTVRPHLRGLRLTGRNRGALPADTAATGIRPWLAGIVPLAVTAALVVFSGGLSGEVRYLRLAFSVAVGLTILNVVGVAVASALASRAVRISGRLVFVPALLIGAGVTAIISRWFELNPPFIVGVIISAVYAVALPVVKRAIVSLALLMSLALLATLAWVLHSAIGPVEGFWGSIPSEVLATITIAGFGSVIMLLLPVGALPGRVLLEWSKLGWLVAALALTTLGAAVLVGEALHPVNAIVLSSVAVVFAAFAVAAWGWTRFVRPAD